MKILYAIQGTGNGHVARAREIVPLLQKHHEVDVLISGTQSEVKLPFNVKYTYNGLGFVFGKKGGVDLLETYKQSNLKILFSEINSLPVQAYDLVISDFEPVSAWACYQKNKMCIGISHQAAVLNKNAPQPKNFDPVGKAILKNYAPVKYKYGFHFKPYDSNIFTPVIRQQVRHLQAEDKGHYTVYLPAYSDEKILKVLGEFKDVKWQVFSKHNKAPKTVDNIDIKPIDNNAFIASMAASTGVLCGAGFETPAEALFLKKKLLVIPMKGQYEQQCNAAALKSLGVPIIKTLKKKHLAKLENWLNSTSRVEVDYADETGEVLNDIIARHASQVNKEKLLPGKKVYSLKKFSKYSLQKILSNL